MPKILLVEDNEMNRDMLSRRLVMNTTPGRWTWSVCRVKSIHFYQHSGMGEQS